jgi:YVTN family beta-propeller protein
MNSLTQIKCIATFVIFLLLVGTARSANNLITNGDFEAGNFAGWTVTPAPSGSDIFVDHGPGPDTTFGAYFGAIGADFDSISQSFATTPGSFYTLTFFYQVTNLGNPIPANNGFDVLWNGVSVGGGVFPQFDVNPGYGTFTFHLQATSALTTLQFNGRNEPSFDFLDDVSVIADKIYVACFKSGKISVFLPNGVGTTPKIKTQGNPAGVAVASNGNVYVANFGANTVTTYNPDGKRISPTITGLSRPFALAFSPNGLLCVLNQTSATITEYLADGTPEQSFALPNPTTSKGFAIAPDGSFWVSQTNSGNIIHLDENGNLVASYFVGGAPAGVALPNDGSVLFADTNGNDVARLDPSTGNVTTFVSGLARPLGLAIDSNGKVYVSNSGNNTVTTYDSAGNAIAPTLATSAYPLGIAVP